MWYSGQSDAFVGLSDLGAVRRTRLPVVRGDDRVRTEAQIDRLIALRKRTCERRRGQTFELISRAPFQYRCNPAPVPAPVPQPTPTPVLPTPPGTVVAPGLTKLPRGRLLQLLADARRECRRKGGHLTIKSLQPLEYTCDYFGAAPGVTPPTTTTPPVDLSQPPYAAPAGAQWQWTGTAWQLIPIAPSTGGPQITAPADYPGWSPGGGIYTPSPGGGPTFDTAGGGVPGSDFDMPGQYPVGPSAPGLPSAYPGAAPGAPLYEPLPEGMQPEEEYRSDVPSYQDAGFPPSPFMPSDDEPEVDFCSINAPIHTSDEFGPLNTLQVVCAPPPAAPSGGYDVATIPQTAVEYGDIQAMEAPEGSMFGMSNIVLLGRYVG